MSIINLVKWLMWLTLLALGYWNTARRKRSPLLLRSVISMSNRSSSRRKNRQHPQSLRSRRDGHGGLRNEKRQNLLYDCH